MNHATLDRRSFIKTSGHLILGFTLFPLINCTHKDEQQFIKYSGISERPHKGKDLIDSWIRLDADGHVTVLTGKKELGQGIRTALLQIAADELEVDIKRCHIINGDTGQTANEGYTAGSNSIEGSGMAIRRAAAEVKFFLKELAASKWGIEVSALEVEDGWISSTKGKLSYWELVEGNYFERKITGDAPTLDYQKYQLVGKPVLREDIKNMVLGKAHFIHDLRMEGMVHARVLHPPAYGAQLKSFDKEEIESLPGILKVIIDGSFLAVIAQREFQAIKAWQKMKEISIWDKNPISPLPNQLFRDFRASALKPQIVKADNEIRNSIQTASKKLKATYHRPYQMHASTGPSCAIAKWEDENLIVWSPTQGVYPLRETLADLFQINSESIRCIGVPGSGCYGHNGADDVSAEAALIAKSLSGKPIRLQWMREDEHAWEPYGSAMIIELEGGLKEDGKIEAWDTHIWSDTHSTRPRGEAGNFVSARHLEKPFDFNKGGYSGGAYRNATPLYNIPHHRLQLYHYDGPLRVSAMRGLGAYGNIFALESFMDELAETAGIDTIDFRIKNLKDDRAIAVLKKLATITDWYNLNKIPEKGYGVAFAKYKNTAAYFAVMAEVEIIPDQKTFHLKKLTGVIDAGQYINPDGLINQTEGGMIQSASWTLMEAVRYDENGVLSKDWNTYPIMRCKAVPEVEVHIINHPELPPLGAGEAAQGPVAAAIANAVFDSTGKRVRELPITAEKITW